MPRPHVVPTFDDGPDPHWTPRVLDALAQAGWRATFFVIAARAACHPQLVSRVLDEGHEVALHCLGHVGHDRMTAEEGEFDASLGFELMRRHLGDRLTPRWRPPYGVRSPWQAQVAARLGLELAWWNVDSRDWCGLSASEMHAAASPRLRDGSVLLMHDGAGPGVLREGAEQTVELISLLARDGVESAPW